MGWWWDQRLRRDKPADALDKHREGRVDLVSGAGANKVQVKPKYLRCCTQLGNWVSVNSRLAGLTNTPMLTTAGNSSRMS